MFLLRMPQTFADGKQSVGGIKGNRADPAQVGGELAGGMQLGGGDFGGRVFLLHEDKLRRILFFLAKVTAENLFVKLSAKTKAPPSNHVASAAAEGAVLFIYCSRRSTSRTFPPSTAVAVALPSTRSPERNLSRASFLNSLTALIIALSLYCHSFHPMHTAVHPPLNGMSNCLPILRVGCCSYRAFDNDKI